MVHGRSRIHGEYLGDKKDSFVWPVVILAEFVKKDVSIHIDFYFSFKISRKY